MKSLDRSPPPHLRIAAFPVAACAASEVPTADTLADRLADAGRRGIDLAVFPEMSLSPGGLSPTMRRAQLERLAEPIDGALLRTVSDAAARTGVAAGVGWLERGEDGRLFNSYAVCLPDGARHRHRKLHVFENRQVQAGDCVTVFDTPWGARMSILIGADNYVPENARVAALMGAAVLIAPHRSGAETPACPPSPAPRGAGIGVLPADAPRSWRLRSIAARAGDNGMFAVLSDVIDADAGATLPGAAMIVDTYGQVIDEAGTDHAVAYAELDPALVASSAGRRMFAARRPDLYAVLASEASRRRRGAQPALWAGAGEPAPAARERAGRGSIALSFAVVGRRRATW
jgi:predicted amidohydrolase